MSVVLSRLIQVSAARQRASRQLRQWKMIRHEVIDAVLEKTLIGQSMFNETQDPEFTDSAKGTIRRPPRAPRSRRRRLLRALGLATALGIVIVAVTGFWLYRHLDRNIRSDSATEKALSSQAGR